MSKLNTAVIGAGYLGKFHAEKYAGLPDSALFAVVDTDTDAAGRVASQFNVQALNHHEQLLGKVDAVSIATPTTSHYRIAKYFLEHGVHVLIEKPITVTLAEADELIALGEKNQLLIQVGHLERFNAAMMGIGTIIEQPLFIESNRIASFNPRATDVNVVLDLMIHDIDIILDIVKSDIKSMQVSGGAVLTKTTDIASARLQFKNGCVANVTASRVSAKTERIMRIFQHDACIVVDFHQHILKTYRKGEKEMFPGIPEIISEKLNYDDNDPIKLEIAAFLDSIQNGTPITVSGNDGRRALDAAIQITQLLKDS